MRNRSIGVTAAGLLLSLLTGCASFNQKNNEVWLRKPGERLLGSPAPVLATAREHWQYAWLSEAAYQETRGNGPDGQERCAIADQILVENGWERWKDFPKGDLAAELQRVHLRADVWYNKTRNEVAVAFGGTDFTSGPDWVANLRWFIPGDGNDQYTKVVRDFIPAFRDQFVLLSKRSDYPALARASLVSTGHSLGGGLAQQFAYARVLDPALPRVDNVYAFNSSPVTGYFSVAQPLREANEQGLHIHRIYERGEILASVRSLLSVGYPPSASNPEITGVRYAFHWTPGVVNPRGAIGQHSLLELAKSLTDAAELGINAKALMTQACVESPKSAALIPTVAR